MIQSRPVSSYFLLTAAFAISACSGADADQDWEGFDDPGFASGGADGWGAGAGGVSGGGLATGGDLGAGGVLLGTGNTGPVEGSGGLSSGAGGALSTGGGMGSGASGGSFGGQGSGGSGGSTGSGGDGNGDCTATGFHVVGTKIYDSNCNEFVMRGVNYPYSWYKQEGSTRFSDMAGRGVNTVRVVLSTGDQWEKIDTNEVTSIISWLKSNQMVGVLEVHDYTGYGDKSGVLDPTNRAVSYWTSIQSALSGNEAYVMINIANEPFGNVSAETDRTRWETFHSGAIQALRNAGFKHTLIVDGPNWAQDWRNIMRDNTQNAVSTVFDSDTERNTVFAVHMYDVFDSSSVVQTYFNNFLQHGHPLIIGEFAADHGAGNNVDEGTIMSQCESRGLGYLGWSWSGNSGDLASLDITNNFNAQSLTSWGSTLITGSNGIEATAETCSCFD